MEQRRPKKIKPAPTSAERRATKDRVNSQTTKKPKLARRQPAPGKQKEQREKRERRLLKRHERLAHAEDELAKEMAEISQAAAQGKPVRLWLARAEKAKKSLATQREKLTREFNPRSESIRTVSGGGGPGTGKRR